MYISRLRIKNFRNFSDSTIEFHPTLNIIIGENNSGKTNLLKALALIFNRGENRRLTINDFNKTLDSFNDAPEITIQATIQGTEEDTIEDKAVVATWLTKITITWEATLTYKYFLPESELEAYSSKIAEIQQNGGNIQEYWSVVESFLPKYTSRLYGGNPDSKNKVDTDTLHKFDYIFLDAIRDVESKMFTGKNPELKQVLKCFLDYDIQNSSLDEEDRVLEKDTREKAFRESAAPLLEKVRDRISLQPIQEMAKETGADKGGIPNFEAELREQNIMDALTLMIEKSGFRIPVTSNGLGYNNLIYIALTLARIQSEANQDISGVNSKIFPIFVVEEPEAHLHPALQYQFLRFLKNQLKKQSFSRQVFITSHSPNITSAVGLENLICVSIARNDELNVSYPNKVFSDSDEDLASKHYIERYLDTTKSNMLFSKGIIFVEGIAELLLIKSLAEHEGFSFEENHVIVIAVEGLTFKHFIKLFGSGINGGRQVYALNKKVACIVDLDPRKKRKNTQNARWRKCWPFEPGSDTTNYEYLEKSSTIDKLKKVENESVKIFHSEIGLGKTFEYDLAYENPELGVLLNESINDKHQALLKKLVEILNCKDFSSFAHEDEDEEVKKLLDDGDWEMERKKRAKIAANYLNAVSKGENALFIQYAIDEKLENGEKNFIQVPKHIRDAIEWACDNF